MSRRGKLHVEGSQPARRKAEPFSDPDSPRPSEADPDQVSNPETTCHSSADAGRAGRHGTHRSEPPLRRPKSERENAFQATAWLLEGAMGLVEELRHNDLGLPEQFWAHAYASRRELLLALRELIDAAIKRCDYEESRATEQQKRRQRRGNVKIDY
jgi:hypothetical protein